MGSGLVYEMADSKRAGWWGRVLAATRLTFVCHIGQRGMIQNIGNRVAYFEHREA
jgi:hypothetical protein